MTAQYGRMEVAAAPVRSCGGDRLAPGNASSRTRQTLLRAATKVFTARGFADAAIMDIVAHAGCGKGVLHQYFGGKDELFLALWYEYQHRQEQRTAAAVARARDAGAGDSFALFAAGARGFLDGNWIDRELTRLFACGDGPPGFEALRQTCSRDWTRRNAILLCADDVPLHRVIVSALSDVVGEAGWEISHCESAEEATKLTDDVVRYLARFQFNAAAPDG